MARLFANNAASTLLSAITNVATSLTLASGAGSLFPSPTGGDFFELTLTQAGSTETSWEIVQVTARAGDVLTVVRGYAGTTAAAWGAGAKAEIRVTADILNDFTARLNGLLSNSQSAAYTTTMDDAGRQIFHPSADTTARTWTIAANASVPYPVGTSISFINQHGAGVITIAIATDAMYLAGAGTTGSRTLAASGIATAIKVTPTEWLISGNGLT